MSQCPSVCAIARDPEPQGLETFGQRAYQYNCKPWKPFFFNIYIFRLLGKETGYPILVCLAWRTSLLWIVGELSGGGSLAVAVGFIGLGGTFHTRQEMSGVPYTWFFFSSLLTDPVELGLFYKQPRHWFVNWVMVCGNIFTAPPRHNG